MTWTFFVVFYVIKCAWKGLWHSGKAGTMVTLLFNDFSSHRGLFDEILEHKYFLVVRASAT